MAAVTASGASSGAGADADAAPERAALAGSGGGGSDDARASAAASADGASRGGAVLADGRGSPLYVGGLLLAGCFCGGPAPPPAPLDWRPAKNAPAHSNAVMAGQGGARILGPTRRARECAKSTYENSLATPLPLGKEKPLWGHVNGGYRNSNTFKTTTCA